MLSDISYHRYGPTLHFSRQLQNGFIGFFPTFCSPHVLDAYEDEVMGEDSQRPIRKRTYDENPLTGVGMYGAGIGSTPSEEILARQKKLLGALPSVLGSKRAKIDIAPIVNSSQSSSIHLLH
jgi:hypothetical protein